MKTYLFDTFNRYKRFSEKLDAETILCNKSWWVFNDSGEKEVYIFNTDGTLIISVSGRVTNATWQYISANKSIVITGNNQSYMVKPAFYDQMIFALQVDGTNDYAFLIDENNLPSTNLRSLADLKEHFAEKERQAVLAEERKRQAELAALMQKQLEEDLERERLAKEAEEKRIRAEKEAEYNRIKSIIKHRHFYLNLPDILINLIDLMILLIGILSVISLIIVTLVTVGVIADYVQKDVSLAESYQIIKDIEGFYLLSVWSYILLPFNICFIYFVCLFKKRKWPLSLSQWLNYKLHQKCQEYLKDNQKD